MEETNRAHGAGYDSITVHELAERLRTIHPADLRAGIETLGIFAATELRDPYFKNEFGSGSAIEELCWTLLAVHPGSTFGADLRDFNSFLESYADLLHQARAALLKEQIEPATAS